MPSFSSSEIKNKSLRSSLNCSVIFVFVIFAKKSSVFDPHMSSNPFTVMMFPFTFTLKNTHIPSFVIVYTTLFSGRSFSG